VDVFSESRSHHRRPRAAARVINPAPCNKLQTGRVEAGGDQSVNIAGLQVIEHDPENVVTYGH
jgi:hypothetical protein